MADLSLVTADDLKTRYPVFKDADAGLIGALLEEARGSVNDTWIEADQKPALLAFAAYLLSNEIAAQAGSISLGGQAAQVSGAVQEIWVGDVKAKFAAASGGSGSGGDGGANVLNPAAAMYLGRYRELYRRSFPCGVGRMNIRVTIESESRGNAKAMLERILRDFAKVKAAEATVKVGFPAGKTVSDIIAIAVYNHEGTSRGIPPRPFITRALYQARGELKSFMRAEARGIITGKISVTQALPRLGIWGQGKIQQQIGSNMPPPNAPSTIRQKGSSKTLIDTGRMRQSVTWAVG